MEIANSYLIFKTDFKNRNWKDWFVSHISALPPFRFKGAVAFNENGLNFSGYDTDFKEEAAFTIAKSALVQLYYGFDETFHRGHVRNLGFLLTPIRFTFKEPELQTETDLYLIAGHNGLTCGNKQLFEELKLWFS